MLEYHSGEHHQVYGSHVNALIKGTDFEDSQPKDTIKRSPGGISNNAAQVWNHIFYWNGMKREGGGAPSGVLADAIDAKWGSFDGFKEEFAKSCAGNFGSGWTWLVKKADGSVDITNTSNAACPLNGADRPLLTCKWERAYYIDYRNLRSKYVETFFGEANWDFAAKNFA